VHDYLDILGISNDAPPSEVRRALARRVRRSHPDFRDDGTPGTPNSSLLSGVSIESDVAVDFADMANFLDRIQASFFSRDVR
jgi:hypothetical protein